MTLKPSLLLLSLSGLISYSAESLADHGSLGFGVGTASPIITQSGVTLPNGNWAAGLMTQFISFKSASNQMLIDKQQTNGDIHSVNTFLQPSVFAAYGVTDDLTVGIRVPYTMRSGVRTPTPDGDVLHLGAANGFGDVSLFGQYRFFHSADNLTHASLVVGLKTPTGATRVSNSQGTPFEAHHQPGSGSWNPSAGLSVTHAMGEFSLDSSVLYTVSTRGNQQTDMGDVFGYNIALSYAFGAPVRNGLFAVSNNAPWTAVLELNGEWQDYQRVAGVRDPNSGGHTIYISPGVRFSGDKNWNTALSVGAPVLKEVNGFQTPPDYRITYRFTAVF